MIFYDEEPFVVFVMKEEEGNILLVGADAVPDEAEDPRRGMQARIARILADYREGLREASSLALRLIEEGEVNGYFVVTVPNKIAKRWMSKTGHLKTPDKNTNDLVGTE